MREPDPALFELETWQGTRVVRDEAGGTLRHAAPESGRFGQVLALRAADRPDVCLLFAPGGKLLQFALDGEPAPHAALGFTVAPAVDGGCVLIHPINGRYLCAVVADGESGEMVADRTAIGPWEQFRLVPAGAVSVAAAADADMLAAALPWIASAAAALGAIRNHGSDRRLRLLLPLLRRRDAEWLGRMLRRDPIACSALARLYPGDPWAGHALPALSTMPPGRTAQGFTRTVDASFEHLAHDGFDATFRSMPHLLNAFARQDRAPTRQLCLLATVRNEGLYLLEWIAFHRALGVEGFFIYTNDNDDGSDDLLSALAASGVVNLLFNPTSPGVSPQYKAYGHAFQILPELLDFRWAGVVDLDEFIVIDRARHASIPSLLAAREADGADAVALNWLMFGSGRQTHRTREPLTARFTTRDPSVNPHIKTISRPHRFIHSQPHYPVWDAREDVTLLNAAGAEHPKSRAGHASAFSPAPDDHTAWVAHYFTKSAEEFLLRRAFARADGGLSLSPAGSFFSADTMRLYTDQHDTGANQVDRRAAECVPDLEARMAELRALPGVETAMGSLERRYGERLRSVVAALHADPRFHVAGSRERWFLDVALHGAESRGG